MLGMVGAVMRPGKKRTGRRGAAVVEMAVVTPLLLTLLLGIIQYGYLFMCQQSIVHAASEACRVATLPGTTQQDIQAAVDRYMSSAKLSGYTVAVQRANPPTTLTESVSVSIPYERVCLVGDFLGGLVPGELSYTSMQRAQ